jgi:hypothetical protein
MHVSHCLTHDAFKGWKFDPDFGISPVLMKGPYHAPKCAARFTRKMSLATGPCRDKVGHADVGPSEAPAMD